MTDVIELGDITISVAFKAIKNVHLTVHPPDGQVSLVAPLGTRPEVARSSPPISIRSDDFPEPEGPTSPTVSPA